MISRINSSKRTALIAAVFGHVIILAAAVAANAASPIRSLLAPTADYSPEIVNYQGFVEVAGSSYSGNGYFKFAIVNEATGDGTITYWSNDGTASGEPTSHIEWPVADGLFDIMLGDASITGMDVPLTASVFEQQVTYLRVWFSSTSGGPFQALNPNQRIASVPYALRAEKAFTAESAIEADFAYGAYQAALADVALAVGNNSDPCTSSLGGSLRWTGTALEVCDGSDWRSVQLDAPPPPPMVLYSAGVYNAAAINRRIGADGLCQSAGTKPAGFSNYRAFISVNSGDEIRDMPNTYSVPQNRQIDGPNGAKVADDWADLLDGSIDIPLTDAGINDSDNWWSGSFPDGSLHSSGDCSGWTTTSGSGALGIRFSTASPWMLAGTNTCASSNMLLCLAY